MKLKHDGQHVFRTGQRIAQHFKPTEKEKEDKVIAKEKKRLKEFAQSAIERFNDQKREERLRGRPDPPPLVTLEERLRGGSNLPPLLFPAKTETQKMVSDWYSKPDTIRENVGGVPGMESFEPPPVLLGPVEKED